MRTNRQMVIALTVVMLGVGWLLARRLVLEPHQRAMQQAQRQLTEERDLLRTQQAIATNWPVFRKYQRRLPPEASPAWLMSEVAALAEQAHVRLITMEPEAERSYQTGAAQLMVRVQLESRYHDVATFISLLENSPKYIHVDELSMDAAPLGTRPDQSDQINSVRMTLSTLYVPAPWGP